MSNLLYKLKKEIREVIPIVLFFFVIFTQLHITEVLMRRPELQYTFWTILINSLIMGKVVLLSKALPWISYFSEKPKVYSVLWRTSLYMVCCLYIRFLEHFIPYFFGEKSARLAFQEACNEFYLAQFWVAQMWLTLFLGIIATYEELVSYIGQVKVRELFFGKKDT